MSDEKKARLTWKGKHPTAAGGAGGIVLFTYTWEGRREHPGEPWTMWSDLPGFAGSRWRAADPADLEDRAEEILATWLAKVNGSPL